MLAVSPPNLRMLPMCLRLRRGPRVTREPSGDDRLEGRQIFVLRLGFAPRRAYQHSPSLKNNLRQKETTAVTEAVAGRFVFSWTRSDRALTGIGVGQLKGMLPVRSTVIFGNSICMKTSSLRQDSVAKKHWDGRPISVRTRGRCERGRAPIEA